MTDSIEQKAVAWCESMATDYTFRSITTATGQCIAAYKAGYTADKWVSVDDALPDKTDLRPVSRGVKRNREPNVIVATLAGRVFETSYSGLGWANLNSRTDYVTHWMPLPNQPIKE